MRMWVIRTDVDGLPYIDMCLCMYVPRNTGARTRLCVTQRAAVGARLTLHCADLATPWRGHISSVHIYVHR